VCRRRWVVRWSLRLNRCWQYWQTCLRLSPERQNIHTNHFDICKSIRIQKIVILFWNATPLTSHSSYAKLFSNVNSIIYSSWSQKTRDIFCQILLILATILIQNVIHYHIYIGLSLSSVLYIPKLLTLLHCSTWRPRRRNISLGVHVVTNTNNVNSGCPLLYNYMPFWYLHSLIQVFI